MEIVDSLGLGISWCPSQITLLCNIGSQRDKVALARPWVGKNLKQAGLRRYTENWQDVEK